MRPALRCIPSVMPGLAAVTRRFPFITTMFTSFSLRTSRTKVYPLTDDLTIIHLSLFLFNVLQKWLEMHLRNLFVNVSLLTVQTIPFCMRFCQVHCFAKARLRARAKQRFDHSLSISPCVSCPAVHAYSIFFLEKCSKT